MIQLIASDMDGTLLNNSQSISEENIQAIQQASEQGIQFVIATGRGYTEAKPALDKANITCPMITVNGAQIYDDSGISIFTASIDDLISKSICQSLDEESFYYEIATTDGVYSINQAQRLENVANFISSNRPELSYKMAVALSAAHLDLLAIKYVDTFDDIIQQPEIKVLKFIVFNSDGPDGFKSIRSKLEKNPEIVLTSSHPNNLEINHVKAQKGIALMWLANRLGVPIKNTMSFGDNFNDVSMLKVAGIGVAMGNAEPEVKKIADCVTETNINSGVGKKINAILDLNN